MLFLIASAPDTKEFKTAFRTAKEVGADICLLQNAIYAARNLTGTLIHILRDDMQLRGIGENEISGKLIDYSQLVDLMIGTDIGTDKVVGLL